MKHAVMIAYNFPPEGNAGTIDPCGSSGSLPHLGWIPTVIIGQPSQV